MLYLLNATTGNDANDGHTAPWKSFANTHKMQPGDKLTVSGFVQPSAPVYLPAGTATAPITVQGDGTAIIDGSLIPKGNGSNLIQPGPFSVFRNFTVQNNHNGANLAVYAASNVLVSNVQSYGGYYAGIMVGASTAPACQNVTIEDCFVSGCCLANQARTATGGWASGIQVASAGNVQILRCRVQETFGEGIGFDNVTTGVIEACSILDCYSIGIYLDNTVGITLTQNLTGAANPAYFRMISGKWTAAVGLCLATEVEGIGLKSITADASNFFAGSPGWSYANWGARMPMVDCAINPVAVGLNGFPASVVASPVASPSS